MDEGGDPFRQQQQQQQQQHQDAGKLLNYGNLNQRNNPVPPTMAGYTAGQQMGGLWQNNFDSNVQDGMSPSDSWSTGSGQGQPIPTGLNVEDWYVISFCPETFPFAFYLSEYNTYPAFSSRFQFFGINGDTPNLGLDVPMT